MVYVSLFGLCHSQIRNQIIFFYLFIIRGSKSLVSLQIRPVSVMKVSDLNMDKIKEGEMS